MTTAALRAEAAWARVFRWGPYALLGLGAVVSALTWQLLWGRALRTLPVAAAPRLWYFAVRTGLAFGLSWLNPFFSIFAIMGYFDVPRHLPRKLRRWGLLAVAATVAASQAALPDSELVSVGAQLGVFAALFALHASLALVLDRFSDHEAQQRSEQKAAIDELAVANTRLEQALAENETLQTQLLVQAREAGAAYERRRLAAEIHDTLAQGLTGIITQLQASLDRDDGTDPRPNIEQAVALARHSLGEARRSVRNLTPGPLVQRTLPEAIKEAVDRWAAAGTASIELTVTGVAEPLHEEIEVTLLRIAEEALCNAAKHADAARVGITLSYLDDEVTLDVRDDGHGFEPGRLPPRRGHGGFGLDGIRTRAERVAGQVEVESEPGCGTALAVRVPLVRHAA